jgi:predicted porin
MNLPAMTPIITDGRISAKGGGVNVAYAISPALALSLEADLYRTGLADRTASVDMFGVGLTYRFRRGVSSSPCP